MRVLTGLGVLAGLTVAGVLAADEVLQVNHSDCPFFGASHDKIVQASLRGFKDGKLVSIAGRDLAATSSRHRCAVSKTASW
jgi:hypothetical protein